MAASHRQLCDRARIKWDKASKMFCDWAIANGFGNVRRNELAAVIRGNAEGETLLAADRDTRQALEDAESNAVAAGHAWRGTFGSVTFYSPSEIRRFSAQRLRRSNI